MNSDELYISLAIDKAWEYQLLTYPNPAVGALILYKNQIIALQAHQKAGTSHAEILALLEAYEFISKKSIDFNRFDAKKAHNFLYSLPKNFFKDIIIYVTLEPCSHIGKTPSCAMLISHLKPKKVVVGVLDPIEGHNRGLDIIASQNIEIKYGVVQDRARELIEPFLIWQKKAFILFKIAQTLNGNITGGYLTSKESLKHVHELRAVCSTMLIGGNSVRVDRPTLDCRFIDNIKAPDIVIYSHRDNFDRDIPLFSIPNREVNITDKLDFDKGSFILIEGGGGMLNAIRDKIDWLLVYQTPKISSTLSYSANIPLKFLHQNRKDIDLIIWNKILL